MNVSLTIYQHPLSNGIHWTTVGLGPLTREQQGRAAIKVQQALTAQLKDMIRTVKPVDLWRLHRASAVQLERVRLDLSLRKGGSRRKVTGRYPLILEPRWIDQTSRIYLVYHPLRQQEWFPLADDSELIDRATVYLQKVWAGLRDETLDSLVSGGKDRLRQISFSANPPSLLDDLPGRKGGVWDDLNVDPFKGAKQSSSRPKVLRQLGVDQTSRAAEGTLTRGMSRSPYREQLQLTLTGSKMRPTLVVGPPQVGKTTLLSSWVCDLLEADGFAAHRNLDTVHRVYRLSGQRIISGMSYLGDWEQRCLEILQEVRGRKRVLWVDDLPSFTRLGRARGSDRNLADFFRGPLARGELVMVGECTPQQLQKLEEEAPSFAALFSRVHVAESTPAETMRMLMHELRRLEKGSAVTLDPLLLRPLLDLCGSLFPAAAFPGKALDMLRALFTTLDREATARAAQLSDLLALFSSRTGLPRALLDLEQTLNPAELTGELEMSVMGQPEAVSVAADLVLRIRAGLTEPRRPYGVFLFTGPTGTGKTELAKSLAHYLYGDPARLLRFDMGEYSGPDAVLRLVGDPIKPRGLLVEQVARQPFCLLLLDEIEKAHPQVLNLMLQLFDEGRLTDAEGNSADFSHAVVVMTSNLGARAQAPIGFTDSPDAVLAEVAKAVREFFPPELFGRIDRVVPFRPLSVDVARHIARKELAALLARRGLADRQVLVQPTAGVIEQVVRRGFDAQYGARTVKRYLEREITALLARRIVRSPRAQLQLFRVFTDGDRFGLNTESLTEADSTVEELPLEPLLHEPIGELRARIGPAMDYLDALLSGEDLQRLTEQIGHHLASCGHQGPLETPPRIQPNGSKPAPESSGTSLGTLSDLFGSLHVSENKEENGVLAAEGEPLVTLGVDLLENKEENGVHGSSEPDRGIHAETLYNLEVVRESLGRVRGRLGFLKAKASSDRRRILEALAEVTFLRRVLGQADDPGRHAVLVELRHLGLVRRLPRYRADGRRGLLERLARAYLDRRVELEGFAVVGPDGLIQGASAEELEREAFLPRLAPLVLRLSGPGALDFFSGETGCHIWRSLGRKAEVVRVRVTPAPGGLAPAHVLEQDDKKATAFEEALEAGADPLPENPGRLLPLVREYRFDPPGRSGRSAELEIVDYALGYAAALNVRTLTEGLERLWLLRMSRHDPQEG